MNSFGAIMAFACLYGWFGSCASRPIDVHVPLREGQPADLVLPPLARAGFVSLLAPSCAQLFGTKGLATSKSKALVALIALVALGALALYTRSTAR